MYNEKCIYVYVYIFIFILILFGIYVSVKMFVPTK